MSMVKCRLLKIKRRDDFIEAFVPEEVADGGWSLAADENYCDKRLQH